MRSVREVLIGAAAAVWVWACVGTAAAEDAAAARAAGAATEERLFARAAASAEVAGYSLSKVQRWLHEAALKRIDAETGLYRADGNWNYRDTAADCYPFLVWAAWATDKEALDGPVRKALHAEIRLCNHLDRIPVPYNFGRKAKEDRQSFDRMIFGASEYVKDGLIAIVEATGKDEWFERMKAIEDDVWRHARVDTAYGKVPSNNIEVNGEQIQALARLCTMTGDRKYLAWAERLADYYLKGADFVPTRLRDHGCEIIGGLGLLLGVESEVNPAKAKEYLPPMRKMLEAILARGVNEDGLMYNGLGGKGGLSDGWGYNYVAYLCYDMAAGEAAYRGRVVQVLRSLAKPAYRNYPWEGRSIDGYADSIEGGLYLLNRLPVPEGLAWADREMAENVTRSREPLATARLWGTHKLESNGVRTVLIHALMHTRGLIARPWRQDLSLGAAAGGGGLAIVVKAGKAWSGRLVFDIPRHRLYMGFRRDWPRMNTLPEWFTVEPDKLYTVREAGAGTEAAQTGKELHAGLPVEVPAGGEVRLLVR